MSRETQAAKKRHAARVGRVPVDQSRIRASGFGVGPWIPEYYDDVSFASKDCGSQETWTATQQKWWYEVAGGLFDTTAVRCRTCRAKERARKSDARRVHLEGLAKKKKPNQAPEPTSGSVTPRANVREAAMKHRNEIRSAARDAPAPLVAHL